MACVVPIRCDAQTVVACVAPIRESILLRQNLMFDLCAHRLHCPDPMPNQTLMARVAPIRCPDQTLNDYVIPTDTEHLHLPERFQQLSSSRPIRNTCVDPNRPIPTFFVSAARCYNQFQTPKPIPNTCVNLDPTPRQALSSPRSDPRRTCDQNLVASN